MHAYNYVTLQFITLPYIPLVLTWTHMHTYMTWHDITLIITYNYSTLCYIALHYIITILRYMTLHYLHYMTFHYITLHYIRNYKRTPTAVHIRGQGLYFRYALWVCARIPREIRVTVAYTVLPLELQWMVQ